MDNNNELPRYELIYEPDEMEGVYGVSLVSEPAIEIEAIQFNKECNFSSDDISDDEIDILLSKGEKIGEDWELINEREVTDESVYSINLANVPNQTDGESSQDNELFLVRYEYSPSSTSANSRNFCIKVASSGLSFKKEDLEWSNANPGFGPGGSNYYNLFLYKAGVNCRHKWVRKIYLRKNNKKLTVFEALKWIGTLDKKTQSLATLENNPPEVSQIASPENNYWRLSKEIVDFKCSSEEKRILTSPVLLPEQNIFRNFDGDKCNVFFTKDTIEKLAQNFFKKGYQSNSTLEHKELIDGVFFFESWIVKNPKNDKANELGYDVPEGTWMMSMKVENPEIWKEYVKTGKIKGFSIDSRLGVAKKTQQKNNDEKMNFNKVKNLVIAKILLEAQLKEFKIDDSLTVYAESLDKDMVVFDKDNAPLSDTEFTLDNKVYKTDGNGVITSIEDVKKEEEAPKEEEVKAAEVTPEAPETPEVDVEQLQKDYEVATKRIEELEVENQSLKAELVKYKEELVEMAKQPKTEPINLNKQDDNSSKKELTALDAIRKALKK